MKLNHFKLKTISHIKRYNSIKARVVLSYGEEAAIIIMKAYNNTSMDAKLKSIEEISKLQGVKDEIKVILIKDLIIRNMFRRLFISHKIKKLLNK